MSIIILNSNSALCMWSFYASCILEKRKLNLCFTTHETIWNFSRIYVKRPLITNLCTWNFEICLLGLNKYLKDYLDKSIAKLSYYIFLIPVKFKPTITSNPTRRSTQVAQSSDETNTLADGDIYTLTVVQV